MNSGAVKCWGNNSFGNLGNGQTKPSSIAVDVKGLQQGVVALAAGGSGSCALLNTGSVKCWGSNRMGEVGDGTLTDRYVPTDVVGLTGVVALSAGENTRCAVTTTSQLKCWGKDVRSTPPKAMSVPTQMLGFENVTSAAVGGQFLCVRSSSGGVKCVGDNGDGEIGNGDPDPGWVMSPADVVGLLSNVQQVSCSGTGSSVENACASLSTGGVRCWGNNNLGQLGDGTHLKRNSPVMVRGL